MFIVSPLLMLIIKGISYVPICLKSVEVQYAITLSIKTSLISTIVCLLLAIPVAYFYILLNYHLKTDYTDNKSPYVFHT